MLFIFSFLFYEGPDLTKYDTNALRMEGHKLYADARYRVGHIRKISDEYPYLKSLNANRIYKSNISTRVTLWSYLGKEKGFIIYSSPEYAEKYGGLYQGENRVEPLVYSFYIVD